MYCFWWLINLQLVSGCLVTKFCWGSNSSRAAISGMISQTSTSTIAPLAISPSALGSPSKVLANTTYVYINACLPRCDMLLLTHALFHSFQFFVYVCRLSFSKQRLHQSSTLLTAPVTPLASDSQRPDGTFCVCSI